MSGSVKTFAESERKRKKSEGSEASEVQAADDASSNGNDEEMVEEN